MLTSNVKQYENGLRQTFWENIDEIHQTNSIVCRSCAWRLVCVGYIPSCLSNCERKWMDKMNSILYKHLDCPICGL